MSPHMLEWNSVEAAADREIYLALNKLETTTDDAFLDFRENLFTSPSSAHLHCISGFEAKCAINSRQHHKDTALNNHACKSEKGTERESHQTKKIFIYQVHLDPCAVVWYRMCVRNLVEPLMYFETFITQSHFHDNFQLGSSEKGQANYSYLNDNRTRGIN